jgi:hypothetical protein
MLVHKDTSASTFVPTTVPRTSASVARGSRWTLTRAPAPVRKSNVHKDIFVSFSKPLDVYLQASGGGANYLTVKWCGPTIEHFVLLQTFNSHKSNYKRKIIPATNINKITKTQWHIGTFLSPGADVCSQGNTCQHICVNKGDSYTCQCRMGFVLNADQRTCSRENMKCFH